MALENITTSMDFNRWVNKPEPYDAKTIFDTLDQINQQLDSKIRFKGQKFTIKNPPIEDSPNGEPKEYWFIEDYQEAGGLKEIWIGNDVNNGKDINSDDFDWSIYPNEDYVWDRYDDLVEMRGDPPEIIPKPVLYQPGGESTGNTGDILIEVDASQIAGNMIPAEKPGFDIENKMTSFGTYAYVNEEGRPLTMTEYADRQLKKYYPIYNVA